ncbi:MAG TPA: hypothetical protein VEC17_01810 [Candidatus Binatia bacterium]|nr:hypothetical protein [Candidatus Binatia bacterium]
MRVKQLNVIFAFMMLFQVCWPGISSAQGKMTYAHVPRNYKTIQGAVNFGCRYDRPLTILVAANLYEESFTVAGKFCDITIKPRYEGNLVTILNSDPGYVIRVTDGAKVRLLDLTLKNYTPPYGPYDSAVLVERNSTLVMRNNHVDFAGHGVSAISAKVEIVGNYFRGPGPTISDPYAEFGYRGSGAMGVLLLGPVVSRVSAVIGGNHFVDLDTAVDNSETAGVYPLSLRKGHGTGDSNTYLNVLALVNHGD